MLIKMLTTTEATIYFEFRSKTNTRWQGAFRSQVPGGGEVRIDNWHDQSDNHRSRRWELGIIIMRHETMRHALKEIVYYSTMWSKAVYKTSKQRKDKILHCLTYNYYDECWIIWCWHFFKSIFLLMLIMSTLCWCIA